MADSITAPVSFSSTVASPVDQQQSMNGRSTMKRDVYEAAESGRVEVMHTNSWKGRKTIIGNNVLHIHVGKPLEIHRGAVMENASMRFIQYVLDNTAENSLLLESDDRGDTPLHLAARFGHTVAVQEFLQRPEVANSDGGIPGLLNRANNRKDTALHCAARCGHADIVKLLVEADGENALHHDPNNLGETPLFIAAERGFTELFRTIVRHTSLTNLLHKGPCGQTALHVAVICGNKDIVEQILEIEVSSLLIRVQNDQRQTPLHCCAAQNVKKQRTILSAILDHDDEYNSAAYIQDNERRTALHIATLNYNFKGAKMLIRSYPDCTDMVDNKGQTVVHFAATLGCLNTFELFLRKVSTCVTLINEKDNDGNTPLHLLAATTPTLPIHGCFLGLPSFIKRHKELDLMATNDKNLTAGDIIASNDTLHHLAAPKRACHILPRGRRITNVFSRTEGSDCVETVGSVENKKSSLEKVDERISNLRKAGEIRLVVAALIVTVSFTVGITVPGGFDQTPGKNIGLAVLAKKSLFVAFLVSDTIALTLSSLAVICYFRVASQNELVRLERFSTQAHLLNAISLGALMVTFVTGVSAVVSHSLGLVFTITAISMFFFYFYLYLLFGSCRHVLAFMTRNVTARTVLLRIGSNPFKYHM